MPQGPEHPNPGVAYVPQGFPRTGYLPNTPEGVKVTFPPAFNEDVAQDAPGPPEGGDFWGTLVREIESSETVRHGNVLYSCAQLISGIFLVEIEMYLQEI